MCYQTDLPKAAGLGCISFFKKEGRELLNLLTSQKIVHWLLRTKYTIGTHSVPLSDVYHQVYKISDGLEDAINAANK